MSKNIEHYLKKHYSFQHGCFFTTFYKNNHTIYTYSDLIEHFIWNHSFTYSPEERMKESYIDEVVSFYISRKRRPCIYLNAADKTFSYDADLLISKGFQCLDNEAWMLYQLTNAIDIDSSLEMKIVDSDKQLIGFTSVCSKCFEDEYSKCIRREYGISYFDKSIRHFNFYANNELIGGGSIYFDSETAIIHNVGVLKRFRRNGYGTAIVKSLLKYTMTVLKIKEVLLQCDGGGYIERMYNNIGFKNIYRRFGYVL